MASDKEKNLVFTPSDLTLLMEAYKNNIALSTTLLEQQKQILTYQDDIIDKQKDLCSDIDKILERLTVCSTNTDHMQTAVLNSQSKLKEDLTAILNADRLTESKEHGKIQTLIYISYVALGTIIGSLVTTLWNLSAKFNLLVVIAKKLGIEIDKIVGS